MRNIIMLLGIGITLSACAPETNINYLYKTGAPITFKTKTSDVLACQLEGVAKVPSNTQVDTTPSFTLPTYTTPVRCNSYGNIRGNSYSGSTSCSGGVTTGGKTYGGDSYSYDANKNLRNKVEGECFFKKGYVQTTFPIPFCNPKQIPVGFITNQTLINEPVFGSCSVSVGNISLILLPHEQLKPNK